MFHGNSPLHCQLLGSGNVVEVALSIDGMPTVAIIGLDVFVLLEEVGEDGIKNFDVWPHAGGVWTLDLYKLISNIGKIEVTYVALS